MFNLIVEPFIAAALDSMGQSLMSAKKDPLPRVIYQIATQRKQSHIYNFFLRLKEHEVNKVPIFTRLNSFKVILKKIQPAQ